MEMREHIIQRSVIKWFENALLGLNLCPFAHKPYRNKSVQFVVSCAQNFEQCLADVYLNLDRLDREPEVETLLLITPDLTGGFANFMNLLDAAEDLLQQEGWQGVYQIASFHPDYQFQGTEPNDRENWTNRSPFPIFHLLREDSVSRAAQDFSAIEQIPYNNIERVCALAPSSMRKIFGRRFDD